MNLGSGPLASLRVTACRSDLFPSAPPPARPSAHLIDKTLPEHDLMSCNALCLSFILDTCLGRRTHRPYGFFWGF
jgi:hypothetical protein